MFVNAANQCQCFANYILTPIGIGCYIPCQSGFAYSAASANCQPIVIPPTCGANMFVNSTNQCQCNIGYVLNPNAVGCHLSCGTGTFYNSTTGTCQTINCPPNLTFNPATLKC